MDEEESEREEDVNVEDEEENKDFAENFVVDSD